MQLDLNLLTALDALLEEGSVMGAADRLHLSSPAISRALGRIRKLTGDDILVRTGRTMTPTPYALSIREQVAELVRQAHAVLVPSRELDLTSLDRTFTIQSHDALTNTVAPALLGAIAAAAPGVRVRFLPEAAADTDDLRHGRVDLEIGADPPASSELSAETFGHDRVVVVARRAKTLNLESYAAATHILVSRRGRLSDPIDEILTARGLRRHVLASVGTSATALLAVSSGDSLLTTPEAMCRPLIDALGLVVFPLPFDLPDAPIIAVWHQRYDSDPAHAWLRDQVKSVIAARL